ELSRAFNGQSRGLISQSMAQEMFRRQAGGFGLAWLVDGEGDSLSFRLGKGLVIAGNSGLSDDLLDEGISSVAQAYLWPPLPVTVPLTHQSHARP
ncbi:MAG: hypothetical protein JJE04_15955, partial [Acidobacteriia bacterium]|nr:hypothetical protein [Terriglobia bacterium]